MTGAKRILLGVVLAPLVLLRVVLVPLAELATLATDNTHDALVEWLKL